MTDWDEVNRKKTLAIEHGQAWQYALNIFDNMCKSGACSVTDAPEVIKNEFSNGLALLRSLKDESDNTTKPTPVKPVEREANGRLSLQ